jgi:hypothetical protein
MTTDRRRGDWRPNANETGVVAGFNMHVAGVAAVGGAGWSGLRALARRSGPRGRDGVHGMWARRAPVGRGSARGRVRGGGGTPTR